MTTYLGRLFPMEKQTREPRVARREKVIGLSGVHQAYVQAPIGKWIAIQA